MTTNYLNNLTPMRGIAALLTVIFHVDLMLGRGGDVLLHRIDSMLFYRMYLMVDFFFILSGFIMCHVYGTMFSEKINGASFKKFTVARFARVYPLHFFTLLYCIVLYFISSKLGVPEEPIGQIENHGYSILSNLFLIHSMNLHNWFSWVHASWSISTEWWAYMLFPFMVAPLMRMNGTRKVGIAVLCFAGYVAITFLIIPIVSVPESMPFLKSSVSEMTINVSYQYGFLRCLCGFVLGMVMYEAYKLEWAKKMLANGYVFLNFVAIAFLSMHFNLPDFVTVLFYPFILLGGAYGSDGINRVFAWKPLQKIGDWSFSIYLVHQPLMFTIGAIVALNFPGELPKPDFGIGWLICLGFILITLLTSYASYRFIEVPARNWINKKNAVK
jgi:peptidoglycan/LPS O-acetylase OafA/YrhL